MGERVFISYPGRYVVLAESLAEYLRSKGYSPWIDIEQLDRRGNYYNQLQRGIECSDYFIYIPCPESYKSKWIKFEIGVAEKCLGKYRMYEHEFGAFLSQMHGSGIIPHPSVSGFATHRLSGCEKYMNNSNSMKSGRMRNNFRTAQHSTENERFLFAQNL